MNNTNQQISNIMRSRRERHNRLARGEPPRNFPGNMIPPENGINSGEEPRDNNMRNDNDLDMIERK